MTQLNQEPQSQSFKKPEPGIYLHLPFCHSKCTYCGFVTRSFDDDLSTQYLAALEQEIRAFPPSGTVVSRERPVIDTIYLGGGTPSILTPKAIGRLLDACRERFELSEQAEITIEVNPGDTQADRLEGFRTCGINRASLGVQSFLDHQLRATGRDHTADQSRAAVAALRAAGFDNLSLDLIAGLPNQTIDEWKYNLHQALALKPEHLSLYLLEVKEGTKLADQILSGKLPTPDDDLAAEMYETLLDMLEQAGFEAYEISNFARSRALRSRHNLKYWNDIPFFGFGVGAHSYDGDERYRNPSSIHDYLQLMSTQGMAVIDRTSRNPEEKFYEALMMGLRLREGVHLPSLTSQYTISLSPTFTQELQRLLEAEVIELQDDQLRLTRRGVLVSNEVFVALMPE